MLGLIYPFNQNSFRSAAIICWLISAALTLWSYQWQEHLDVGIRKHLVQQSEDVYQAINTSLSASGLLLNRQSSTGNELESATLDPDRSRAIAEIVNQSIDSIGLGGQSFALLVTRSGDVLAYPDYRLLKTNVRSSELPEESLLSIIVNQFPMGELMTFDHPVTGKEQWMVKRYISAIDANLGLVIDAGELRQVNNTSAWQSYLVIFFCVSGVIFFVSSWRFPSEQSAVIRRAYIVLTLNLFSLLLILWNHALEDIPLRDGETVLVDRESVELAWRRSQNNISKEFDALSHPVYLELHDIHLLGADEIRVSGQVLLPKNNELKPFIQIQHALESSWRLQGEFGDRQLWNFVARLKQSTQYQSFPFDQDILTLTLLPIGDDSQKILMPLFDAYDSLAPSHLPGLSEKFRSIGGWHIEKTYFTYQKEVLYPDESYLGLKYNIAIQRGLTGPSISHIMPLCVISLLTYGMLLLWTKDPKKQSLWGFSTATELQYSASLFFILVISHVALRDSLNIQGVAFIEYFYFISYLQIIFIAIGALLYSYKVESDDVVQRKVVILKQWYWPCVFILCILITLSFLK